jgi:two-component system sensor histidine kinase PilS (NtrC family)
MTVRSRLLTLNASRVLVSTLLFGSAVFVQIHGSSTLAISPFFYLIGLTYALSVLCFLTLRFVERLPWLVDVELSADALLASAFIYVTGGVTSYFTSLYPLLIIAASSLRYRRGALQAATLCAVLYLGLVAIQYVDVDALSGWIQAPPTELPTLHVAQFTVAINLFGFYGVAVLSGSLAERVRRADARLADASNQIEDLRAFNAYVIDSLLSGLVTTDVAGHVLTFNRAASLITGLSSQQVIGRDIGEILQLPDSARSTLRALEQTRSVRFDFEYRTDRGTIEVGLTGTTLLFPEGRRGLLLTFQDVTEVKRLERSVRLRQRLAAVGEMAAGIAHEIRNPLASMSGSIQVLRQELNLTDEQAELMDIVLRESSRLNDTIRSFLAYARPQRAATDRIDLRRTLQETARLLRHGSEVRENHQIDVDAPDDEVWYDADENQIRQIVWNLATNGLRAMREGGRLLLSVRSEPGPDGSEVVIVVQDSGRGIPAEDLEGIFQPFRGSFERGTGLGLAIVHRIVTDYGGSIQVTSAVGKGTAMHVRLPVLATDASMTRPLSAMATGA